MKLFMLASALLAPTLLFDEAVAQWRDNFAPAATSSELQNDQLEVVYIAPTNEKHRPIYERMKQSQVLEGLRQLLGALKLPEKLVFRLEGCGGVVNAFYEPSRKTVTLCYEYIEYTEFALKQAPPNGLSKEDVILGSVLEVALHEMAHGIFDILQIPVLGGEEQAADQFAAFALSQLEKQAALRMLAGAAHMWSFEANRMPRHIYEFANAHGTAAQRYFNLLCIAYGSDSIAFQHLIDQNILPGSRAVLCRGEYERIKAAYSKLFDPTLLAKWRRAQGSDSGDRITLTFDEPLPKAIAAQSSVTLNGNNVRVLEVDPVSRTLTLSGKEAGVTLGMNFIDNVAYWFERDVLKKFDQPYPISHAIIAAIDDYDRKLDPQRRGPTGLPALSGMVENAEKLRSVLLTLGFPADRIRTFYNQEATSENLSAALGDFWEGKKFAGADRVVFYFGGHGEGVEGSGYLVTYDFQRAAPTSTSFLMSDFASRHFPFMNVNHFLAAIDACSSGLAIPGMRTLGDTQISNRSNFAQIKAALSQRARNMIVAGTGASPAWADPRAGGIFTQALVTGLKGDADPRNRRIIQFDELAVYLKREVTYQADSRFRAMQVPSSYKATSFGEGEVIFQLPGR